MLKRMNFNRHILSETLCKQESKHVTQSAMVC